MDIKGNVKYILQQRGMTQTDLANRLGVSKQQVQSYLNGNTTVESLLKMAIALDTTVENIVSEIPLAYKDQSIKPQENFTASTLVCPHCGEEIKILAK